MASSWDSLETLQAILPWARWSTVVATIVSALAATSVVLLTNRIEQIKAAKDLPRSLTNKQALAIVTSVKASGEVHNLTIQVPMGDNEAFDFAEQLNSAFNAAGFKSLVATVMSNVPTPPGLFIIDRPGSSAALKQVRAAFEAAGIPFLVTKNLMPDGQNPTIRVGPKP